MKMSQLLRDSTPQHLHHSSWLYDSAHASCSCRVLLSSALSFSTELTSLIPTIFVQESICTKTLTWQRCVRADGLPQFHTDRSAPSKILRTSCVSGSTKSRTRGQHDDMSSKIRRDPSHFASAGSRVPVQMWWAHNGKSVTQVRQGDGARHFHRQRWKFGSVNFFLRAADYEVAVDFSANGSRQNEKTSMLMSLGTSAKPCEPPRKLIRSFGIEGTPHPFVRNKRQNDIVNAWCKRNG